MSVVELDTVPSLGSLYAGAIPSIVKDAVASGGPVGKLPNVTLRATGITVDADRLSDFEHLTRAPGTDQLPPGLVHAAAFPVAMALLARKDMPLPLAGLVHISNAYEQNQWVRLDSAMTVTSHAEGLRPHPAGTLVDVVSEITDQHGAVVTDRSTYLARGRRLPGEKGERTSHPDFEPPVPTGQWKLSKNVGRRFAAVSGDWNPIHINGLAAKALGMKGVIAHGMYTASRALSSIKLPNAFEWAVEFAAPVLLPATVALRVDGTPTDDDGARFVGWDPRKGRLHLRSTVQAR